MTFFARALSGFFVLFAASAALSRFGMVKPSRPSPPTLMACRRECRNALKPGQAECALSSFMRETGLTRRNGRTIPQFDSVSFRPSAEELREQLRQLVVGRPRACAGQRKPDENLQL